MVDETNINRFIQNLTMLYHSQKVSYNHYNRRLNIGCVLKTIGPWATLFARVSQITNINKYHGLKTKTLFSTVIFSLIIYNTYISIEQNYCLTIH